MSEPTIAARRAAAIIKPDAATIYTGTRRALALLIDGQTGLPELIDLANTVMACFGNDETHVLTRKAKIALSRVTRRVP